MARVSEACSTIRKDPTPPEMGQRFFGGGGAGGGGNSSLSYIHAMDIHTGAKVWDYPLLNGGGTGTLETAGGLVFFGETGGVFTALNSKTGAPLWHFESGQSWRASPMTYMVGGTQYVVIAGDGGYPELRSRAIKSFKRNKRASTHHLCAGCTNTTTR